MVHPSTKKSSNVLFLLLLQLSNGFSYIWMDERPENQIYDEAENRIDDQKFIEKKMERAALNPEVFKRTFNTLVNSATIPIYKTNNNKHCNCGMRFRPMDLGREYFPRYLQTGICEPNSCERFYQCVEKKYNVKVLRKRSLDKDNEVLPGTTLPKQLRDLWLSETIPVGVACECVVDIQTPVSDIS